MQVIRAQLLLSDTQAPVFRPYIWTWSLHKTRDTDQRVVFLATFGCGRQEPGGKGYSGGWAACWCGGGKGCGGCCCKRQVACVGGVGSRGMRGAGGGQGRRHVADQLAYWGRGNGQTALVRSWPASAVEKGQEGVWWCVAHLQLLLAASLVHSALLTPSSAHGSQSYNATPAKLTTTQ